MYLSATDEQSKGSTFYTLTTFLLTNSPYRTMFKLTASDLLTATILLACACVALTVAAAILHI